MEAARLVTSWFWREEVWLPPGYTWDSFQRPQLTRNRSEVRQRYLNIYLYIFFRYITRLYYIYLIIYLSLYVGCGAGAVRAVL